ncbi:MAG: PEP-CTERM sorting domain-containing protein [Planctomycetota bacterium]|nr:MAG: PEP-CTERM sorting domain-containing protein [Planctomycetota bacterium]
MKIRHAWNSFAPITERVAKTVALVAFALVALLRAANVSAEPLAEISGQSGSGVIADVTYGWSFSTGDLPIHVTELGIYDRFEDGLADSHEVGLWRVSDSALLTSTIVPASTAAPLIDGVRYAATTPVTLDPNADYVLGAYYPTSSDTMWTEATVTMNLDATFGTAKGSLAGNGFVLPTFGLNPTFAEGFFGPNLIGTAVPEPSTLALGGLGAIGLAGAWIRTRRTAHFRRSSKG